MRHYLELAELRRTVLQYVEVELGVLLQEEAHRAFATAAKVPKDSKYRCVCEFVPSALSLFFPR